MFIEDRASGETPSHEGFIQFCESKDPNEKYVWVNSHECACGQYLKSIGKFREYWVSDEVMSDLNRIAGGSWDSQKWGGAGGYDESDWTFGKCAERVKKVLETA